MNKFISENICQEIGGVVEYAVEEMSEEDIDN
jgi:hypothetical protein